MKLRQASLPDGTRVFTVRPQEVGPLYQQVQEYCRHGIRVQKGDIVFDVGANIGDLTVPLAGIVGPTGRVYAVESNPDTYHVLCANLALNGIRNTKAVNAFVATNPNVEGEATALYIAKKLKPTGVRVTRIAFGLPVGGDIEYADEVTMARSLENRRDL